MTAVIKRQTSSIYGKLAPSDAYRKERQKIDAHNRALHATSAEIARSARYLERCLERARWGLSK